MRWFGNPGPCRTLNTTIKLNLLAENSTILALFKLNCMKFTRHFAFSVYHCVNGGCNDCL